MKYVLNVTFDEKNEAKKYGARWNAAEKYWYFVGETLPEELIQWYDGALPNAPAAQPQPSADDPFAEYKSVSKVNQELKKEFGKVEYFKRILVKGEVTNYKGPAGGNYYFSIKDDRSILDCLMWGNVADSLLNFEFKKGKQVAICGTFDLYEQKATSRLNVKDIKCIGEGNANELYLQLKEKLKAEGLFDQQYKKSIPKFPTTVGIVTSKDGDARKDIEKIAKQRNPYVQLLLYHANVQGENAVQTLTEGVLAMDKMGLDTIIVSRGGGSEEDLSAFNDEGLARAVFNAKTPIISAVGHEKNWSLIDEVSDKRVATPTEAASVAIPDIMTTVNRIDLLNKNITDNMHSCLQKRFLKLDTQKAKLEGNNPVRKYKERKDRLNVLTDNLNNKIIRIYENRKNRFEVLVTTLHGLSPTAKLVRGFGYISVDDKPVISVGDVKKDDELTVRIHDGQIISKVIKTAKNK